MHIVLLNDDALPDARGGAAIIVHHLRHGFRDAGHKVTLITTHRGYAEERLEDDAGFIIRLPVSYDIRQRHSFCIRNAVMTAQLQKIFTELRPDVVHAHNIHTYLTYESLRLAQRETSTIVLTAHDTFLASFQRVQGSAYERAALQNTGFRMHWWHHLRSAGRTYRPFRNAAIRNVLRATGTSVIAISNATASFLAANKIPVADVIPNGILLPAPITEDRIRAYRSRMNLTGPTILFAGRMRTEKGIGAILGMMENVLQRIPGAQLLLAGEEERAQSFLHHRTTQVRRAVRTTGWISTNDMPVAYAASNVVTVPSLYLDNFPTVNLEAMAAGKPIVGTCFGGTSEAIVEGETGFIRNPRNERAFADAIVKLLLDPALAAQMGAAGRRRAETSYTLGQQVAAYLSLFTS